ncbi:MAG: hypothetical protein RLZZ623_2724 [Actinomycetota bacterium]
MIDRVLRLAALLRRNDIDVSASEVVDALAALSSVDLADPRVVRAALSACMVKRADDGAFDRCFRLAFSAAELAPPTSPEPSLSAAPAERAPSGPAMSDAVLTALMSGDEQAIAALAAQAVRSFGGIDDVDDGSEKYFMHRVLRAIDLSRMLSAAMQQLRAGGDLAEFELMLRRNELTARLEAFRRLLAEEVARRLGDRRGLDSLDVDLPERTRPEDLDLMMLSRSDHDEVRRALQPMIRRLAVRIGRRRKLRSTGRLDARRTVRRSMQFGGVPIDVVNRRRHPARPEIVVLCDVSGSVAEFAQFTFTLVNALHSEVRAVRSFAFVDGVAEVSDLFLNAHHDIAVNRLVERKGVVGLDGHSDYGAAFHQFVSGHLDDAVGPRTSLIICGDARSNYRDGNVDAFATICRAARRVYWLNPEHETQWGGDDSLIHAYSPFCRAVFEVRSLRQLENAIAELV